MSYEPFHERFPEIAERETRTLISMNDPALPAGKYALIEAYCNEANCDCRRVFFNVYSWSKQEMVAVIAYGWESREFYVKWFGEDDPRVIPSLQGPILNLASPQSELAPVLLERIEHVLQQDKAYVARLKRHYEMFRETVDGKQSGGSRRSAKARRNAPCPCGSGKKYKKCCGKRTRIHKR